MICLKCREEYEGEHECLEVMTLDELVAAGSEKPLREAGHIHRAGHDYVVSDGDVIHFVCA